jgi:hypothetical protein
VAARSKVLMVLELSNPVQGMDTCPRLCVLLSCLGRCLAMDRFPFRRVQPKCLKGFVVLKVNLHSVQARESDSNKL